MRHSYLLSMLLLVASLASHAQQPIFTARQVLHYQEGGGSALNARYPDQVTKALTSTFREFSLVDLDSRSLVNYVEENEKVTFVLNLENILTTPITLEPTNMLAEGYVSYSLGANGSRVVNPPARTTTYRGEVATPEGGQVRLMLDGERVQGFITYQGRKMYIQNLSGLVGNAKVRELVVYDADDVIEEGDLSCLAVEDGKQERSLNNQRTQASCNGDWELEVATFATYSRYNDFNSTEGVNNEILGIMNNVQANYDEFNVKIKIVEQVVATCEGCEPWGNVSRNDLLGAFSDWGPGGFTRNHDEGILFYDGAGSGTIGTAWLSTICRLRRYAVVDRLGSALANQILVAHEMGHNFSANHTSTGIMTASLNNSGNFWASSSKSAINNHIDTRTCLACVDGDDPSPQPQPEPEPPTTTLRVPENPFNVINGLDYRYYEGSWNNLPAFADLTPQKSGVVDAFDLSVRDQNDNFGIVFSGFVEVPADGTYTFYTASDDGSQLFIGNTLVVDNDGLHGIRERNGEIGLEAGKHALTVTFFEKSGGESLTVRYAGPTLTKQALPTSALYRTNEDGDGGDGGDDGPTADNALPWIEAFALADGTAEDAGSTGWTTKVLNDYGGSIGVQNGRLAVSAVEAEWLSSKIDIAGVSSFSMTYDYQGDNSGVMEQADYIKIEYRYDNDAWEEILNETDGTSGVSTPYVGRGGTSVSNAQTLQLRITAKTTASNETWYVDNINIQCESCSGAALSAHSTSATQTLVFPNPTTGSFSLSVTTPEPTMNVHLIDLQGRKVFSQANVSTRRPLRVDQSLDDGLYILVVSGEEFSERIKLIKQ